MIRFLPGQGRQEADESAWHEEEEPRNERSRAGLQVFAQARAALGSGQSGEAHRLLQAWLEKQPNDALCLALWLQLGRRYAAPGQGIPGLRDLAGRPQAWRARIAQALHGEHRPPDPWVRSWIVSALEAAPTEEWKQACDQAFGELARRRAWAVLADCADLWATRLPLRASLLAIEAWLQVGDVDHARDHASGLPTAVLERQPWLARLRRPLEIEPEPEDKNQPADQSKGPPAPSAPAATQQASLFEPMPVPLFDPSAQLSNELWILPPTVPRERAAQAPRAWRETLDLAHGLAALLGVRPSLAIRRDDRGRVLAPMRAVTDFEGLEAKLAQCGGQAATRALTLEWLPKVAGRRHWRATLWDRSLRRRWVVRGRTVEATCFALVRRFERARRRLERTRRPRASKFQLRQQLASLGYGRSSAEPRRLALAELLAERLGRPIEESSRDAWRGWWRTAPRALEPRRSACELARLRCAHEDRTRQAVLRELVYGAGAAGDGRDEGDLVSHLRGLGDMPNWH